MSYSLVNPKPFIGRKKTSLAKCNFYKVQEEGVRYLINGRIPSHSQLDLIQKHLYFTFSLPLKYEIRVWCQGGGWASQNLASLKAIAIGYSILMPEWKSIIKKDRYLWYDNRIVERKKYGHHKARKTPQWRRR